jgi:hypothetical protein
MSFANISVSTSDLLDGKLPVVETKTLREPARHAVDPATTRRNSRLRPWLAGDIPGQWSSNHWEQSAHKRGWAYCAIQAKAEAAASCKIEVYEIHRPFDRQDVRKRFYKSLNPDLQRVGRALRRVARQLAMGPIYWRPEEGAVGLEADPWFTPLDMAEAERTIKAETGLRSSVWVEPHNRPPKDAGWVRLYPTFKQWELRSTRRKRADEYRDTVTGDEWDIGQDAERKLLPPSHRLVRFLRKPNPGKGSGAKLLFQISQQKALTGTAYLWIIRNGAGVPKEMYCVPTGLMIPLAPTAEYPAGRYQVSPLSAYASPEMDDFQAPGVLGSLLIAGGILDARDVAAIYWPHPLFPWEGQSPMDAGDMFVDVAEQMVRTRWYGLRNEPRPGMIFEQDKESNASEEELDAFVEGVREKKGGAEGTGKSFIMPRGLKMNRADRPADELDFENGWNQARDSNLALWRTPPVAAGITEPGSYAAYYVAARSWTDLCVQPELDLIAMELEEVLGPGFRQGQSEHGFEIRLVAKSVDDGQLENQRRNRLSQQKCITKDEMRAMEGLPPLPDGRGKVLCGEPDPKPTPRPLPRPVNWLAQGPPTDRWPFTGSENHDLALLAG